MDFRESRKTHHMDDFLTYNVDKTWKILLDFVLGRTFNDHGDMTKARLYGWTTTVDTTESYIQCFDRLKKMKVIPTDWIHFLQFHSQTNNLSVDINIISLDLSQAGFIYELLFLKSNKFSFSISCWTTYTGHTRINKQIKNFYLQ